MKLPNIGPLDSSRLELCHHSRWRVQWPWSLLYHGTNPEGGLVRFGIEGNMAIGPQCGRGGDS